MTQERLPETKADSSSSDTTVSAPGGDHARPAGFGAAQIETLLQNAGVAGRYQVLSQVGAGGAGAVYKAIDTRLNRAVAIKALLDTRLMSPHAAARLRTEALAAASLDHPYICRVYELIEGAEEKLLVMEFVEGETLWRLLRRGPVPLAQVITIATEIAEGLANAHQRGLVHRDLKPANVMVTPHGHVKLLDFGLARGDASSTPTADTQTLANVTDAHAGTPHYMAPEQAAGRLVTARADLFSFGVVLFECLTGELPFKGRGSYDYISHLLSDQPTPVHKLAPDVPADLARLVDQCLDPTPSRRPESAIAVVDALKRLADGLSASGSSVRSIAVDRAIQRRRWILLIGGLAAIGLLAWRFYPRAPFADTTWLLRSFATAAGAKSDSRISPDGKWVAFLSTVGGATQVFVQATAGGDPQPVQLPGGAVMSLAWSADGNQLAYVLRQGSAVSLQVVPAFFGGVPVKNVPVVPAPSGARLLRWIDRVVYLQVSDRQGRSLHRIDLESDTASNISAGWRVTGTPTGFDVRPDGRQVAITLSADGQDDLWVANIDGAGLRRVTNDVFSERVPLWSGTGASVIHQSNRGGPIDLWETSTESGQTRRITSSDTVESPESTSPDGTVLSFQQVARRANLWRWDPVGGAHRQLTEDARSDFSPTATARGTRAVFQRSRQTPGGDPNADSTLFIGDMGGVEANPVVRALGDGFAPRLSPDGAHLVFYQSSQPLRDRLVLQDLGTNETMTLTTGSPRPVYSLFPADWAQQNVAWHPASRELYFVEGPDSWTIRRHRLGTSGAAPPIFAAEKGERIHDLHVATDGRSLAFVVDDAKTATLRVADVASGAARAMARFPGRIYVRGWLAGDTGVVVVQSVAVHEDTTTAVDVVVVSARGTIRRVATVDRAFMATARLDPSTSLLYITRSEQGVHNMYALSLSAGTLRRVTDNTVVGVTFSGLEPLGSGAIIGVRDERTSDIWLGQAGR